MIRLIGYAIVSADGLIADAQGAMPATLRFDADWLYFQDALRVADLVLLGRRTHEAAPNPRRLRRLVVSRQVTGLTQQDEVTHVWNPAQRQLADVLAELLGQDGTVAVAGGTAVYDLARAGPGYHAFHLSIAHQVVIGAGRPLFSDLADLEAIHLDLVRRGLSRVQRSWLDRAAALELVVYERPAR